MKAGNCDDVHDTGYTKRRIGCIVNTGTVAQQKRFRKSRHIRRKNLFNSVFQILPENCRIGPQGCILQFQQLGISLLIRKQEDSFALVECGTFRTVVGCEAKPEGSFQHISGFQIDIAVYIEFRPVRQTLQHNETFHRAAIFRFITVIDAAGG